jgi:thiamine pyrophosphate-dependent acetolactate synthase large subunit-like protein
MKGTTAITNILRAEGVKWVTGYYDGGGATHIIDACREAGIRPIHTRSERVGVNIADGFTRVTNGRPNGVAVVGGGQTVGVAYSGISQAWSDNVPLLVLASSVVRDRTGMGVIQDYDPMHVFKPITKWTEIINYAYRVPELMMRAFTYLRSGKLSPVVLVTPHDVPTEEFADDKFSYTPVAAIKSQGNPRSVEVAVRALLNAKNPIIYAGEGTLYAEAWDELREFAELIQAPVMTTMKSKSVFPENHPLSVGHGGRTGTKAAAHFLKKSDLAFCIGASLQRGAGADVSGRVIVQVDATEYYMNKDHVTNHALLGDAKLVLRQAIDEVKKQTNDGGRENKAVVEEIAKVKKEFIDEWMPLMTSNDVPINPLRVYWELMHTVDVKKTIITHDAGNVRDQLCPLWESLMPRGYVGWGGQSGLGSSMGLAIGAKLARPDCLCIQAAGDGGFAYTATDFETSVREKIPILSLVINNSSLSGGLGLSGDWSKLGEAMGGYSERVEKPDEIIPAIKRATSSVDSGRSAVLEVITKPQRNTHTRYWSGLA